MVAKCFYLSRNLFPTFGYGKLKCVIQTSYSWHLLAQKSFQLPPPKLIRNDYSSTVFEFPKQLHLPQAS